MPAIKIKRDAASIREQETQIKWPSARTALSLSLPRGTKLRVEVHSKFETKSTSRTERPLRESGENSRVLCLIYVRHDRSSSLDPATTFPWHRCEIRGSARVQGVSEARGPRYPTIRGIRGFDSTVQREKNGILKKSLEFARIP